MNQVGQRERQTQNRVVQLFQHQLNYRYLGNWQHRLNNGNIETEIVTTFLRDKQGYNDTLINKALYELNKIAGDQSKNLYDINKEIYSLLRYGVNVKEEAGEKNQTVWLINWKEPLENDFAIAEEVTVKGENDKRPDIVLYINGIALGVLELKRSTVSVSEGIRQNLDNQKSLFIKSFFNTMQLVMAGNDTQGLRYGTIKTKEKYYLTWKEDTYSDIENPLDKHLLQLCEKTHLLELIHNFVVFDCGIKKLCRHNQYFGVKAAQDYISRNEGGIIWHTQGSGKSLTMVWLTKWIREYNPHARVLIMTDREELDEQIEGVFFGVNENIYRTKSGQDLITQLNNTTPWLLCSLIHKFGRKDSSAEQRGYDNYIAQLKSSLPQNFQIKGNVYVFVDECHRTQAGKLHKAMKEILPHALFIGFTGTPILKKDERNSIELFGNYIHTYKFDEAVKDQVVLDLRYEARKVEQNITSQAKIDQWFEAKTRGLTEQAKTLLKQRWGTMQKVLSSKSRLSKIVGDIILDFVTKDRLQSGRGNAILVADGIPQACKYYELFQAADFTKCAIITSYDASAKSIKGESIGDDERTEKIQQYEIYQKMLNGQTPEKFEEEVKEKFIKSPAQMKLLIVVNKLLTGFDAPPATYLYIDKTMRDHTLFQAVCRVNRLDGEDKEYGYIVDYKDLFKSLEKSVKDYTSEAFEDYDADDVAGLLSDRLEKGRERLEESREAIKALCDPVEPPQDTPAYIRYFCGANDKPDTLEENQQKRIALYKYTSAFVRAYANLANDMIEAGYTPAEIEIIKQEVKHYEQVRGEVKLASGDYIDLKAYEPAMRHLIDSYIGAEESEAIATFEDMTLVQLIVQRGADAVNALPQGIKKNKTAVAETIENNLRKVIIDQQPTNPKYFEKMSTLLDELIQTRKTASQEYQDYLRKIVELSKQVAQPSSSSVYPQSLNSPAKIALYDNLNQNEALALAIDAAICQTKKDGWRGKTIKEREVKNAIKRHLELQEDCDSETLLRNAERIFEIVKSQSEY
ncbi:HsdR family type I site-specific deoxyribonuclease [Dolichospermum flos-aquae UHCC 0037]|uniref:HsdR family type I site-specific deoxyribonuclease n=2 Tax=Cyanophyceae TaxID=3028117 RepID=A0ACC7S673_DOLFA|nr:HsdR family type I site-specific deoxyribonuclease [Anabaena sp. 54]MTJ43920.1 HsdR family type I site-specific deoxyribonuclease [Dolichospermum flos-aquae UHCC 0037]